jgi:hypothetical protein
MLFGIQATGLRIAQCEDSRKTVVHSSPATWIAADKGLTGRRKPRRPAPQSGITAPRNPD